MNLGEIWNARREKELEEAGRTERIMKEQLDSLKEENRELRQQIFRLKEQAEEAEARLIRKKQVLRIAGGLLLAGWILLGVMTAVICT